MTSIVLIVLLLFTSFATSQLTVNGVGDITQDTINNNWEEVAAVLNSLQTFDSIEGLTEESLHKIFTLPFPNLINLSFGQTSSPCDFIDQYNQRNVQVLTHRLVEDIFTSQYFPNLKVLNLSNTNLDDRSFAFLEDNITIVSSLENIDLAQNYIGAVGLRRLSSIQFRGLTKFNFNNNLLIEKQAVDCLIQIICQNNTQDCNNKIQYLNIGYTHIKKEGFIQLISKINKTTIKSLNIDAMSFKYKQTLKEGFDYSAYVYLAEQSFPSLEKLQIGVQLNDDVGKIFKDWQLPNLKFIQTMLSSVGNSGMSSWVTRRNMPNLQGLLLFGTNIGDDFLKNLIAQNFSLTFFNIGDTKVSDQGILLCSQLSTHLKTFYMKDMKLKSHYLKQLLTKTDLSSLEYLSFTHNTQISDLFEYFPWQKLQNLKGLKISNCDFSDSYQKLFQNKKALLPNLEFLVMTENKKQKEILNKLFLILPTFFPNLQLAMIGENQFVPISLDTFQKSLAQYKQGMQIDLGWVRIQKTKDKFKILDLDSLATLYNIEKSIDQKMINMIEKKLIALFDFSQIEKLKIRTKQEFSMLLRQLSKAKVSSLVKLRQILVDYKVQAEDFVASLSDISFPILHLLGCQLTVAADIDANFLQKTMIPLFQRIPLLETFSPQITYLNEQQAIEQQTLFLSSLNYRFLKEIYLQSGQMQVTVVEKFLKMHADTLRRIMANGNFFEQGFFTMLADSQITLQVLTLSNNFFTVEAFADFGIIKTEFLYYLDLSNTDLTNEHIVGMMERKEKGPYFPKLSQLFLNGNDIRQQGLRLLMKTGFYSLVFLNMEQNSNPQFVNILLNYPNQIKFLAALNVEIYSLEEDLNPQSVNTVETLVLSTSSFTKQDFSSLARLSFNRLKQVQLMIKNVNDCEVLRDLLKIFQQSQIVAISFTNDNEGLNSSCLSNFGSYTSQVEQIYINDQYVTTYLSEFIQILMHSERDIRWLYLQDTRLPPSTLSKIFDRNLHSIEIIELKSCYLDDATFSKLLKASNFTHLTVLEITSTQITDESIKQLSELKMPNLKKLLLGNNNIGADALAYLSDLDAPKLTVISLRSCQINFRGLRLINNFEFPQLQGIDLSYNNFVEEDILQFVSNLNRQRLPKLNQLDLSGVVLSKENRDALQETLKGKGIEKYKMDHPYNMKQANSASY